MFSMYINYIFKIFLYFSFVRRQKSQIPCFADYDRTWLPACFSNEAAGGRLPFVNSLPPRMKNQPNASRILAALVSRAASLELRFVGKDVLTKFLAMYPGFISGFANPNLSTPPVSMRLGDVQELRFVEAGAYSSCTVIYWAVLHNSAEGIRAACQTLEANCCQTVEAVHSRPDQPETACCLMQDPGGNLFGLIINPPVPWP